MADEDVVEMGAPAAGAGAGAGAGPGAPRAIVPHAEDPDSPWLHAWHDPVASVKTYNQCMWFTDLDGSGESSLLVGTLDKRLKVYKGTAMVSDVLLQDVPVAVCAFYTDTNTPRTPAVAVATGSNVYVYRNLRPYFKFALPPVTIHATETSVWADVSAGTIDATKAVELLSAARDQGVQLSYTSRDLLSLDDAGARADYVAAHRGVALKQQTVVTCMDSICKSLEGDQAVSSLVIGTENREVLILNTAGSATAVRVQLPSVPVFMSVSGTFDVEYRIVVACRNNNVYTVKNGEVTGGVIELESPAVGVVKAGKNIVVGSMDKSFHSYHIKGKKAFSVYLPHRIACMGPVNIRRARPMAALGIGMANGEIRIYMRRPWCPLCGPQESRCWDLSSGPMVARTTPWCLCPSRAS